MSLKGIFSPPKATTVRSQSKTRLLPPFATNPTPTRPTWNRNKTTRSTVQSAAPSIPKAVPWGKSPSAKLPFAHAPDGAEFHQSRPRFVQCRNQSSQTNPPEAIPNGHPRNGHIPKLQQSEHVDGLEPPDNLEPELIAKLAITDPLKPTDRSDAKTGTDRMKTKKMPVKRFNRPVKEVMKQQDPNCPPGHVALEETERVTMLSKLQQSYDQSLHELNRLPLCIDTLRVRTRRNELEKHLQQTEKNIKLFSKPTVYVMLKDSNE